MPMNDPEAWSIRSLLAGGSLNGERERVTPRFLPIVDHLTKLAPSGRLGAWDGFLIGQTDSAEIRVAVNAADVGSPCPDVGEPTARPATLADIRKVMAGAQWLWPNYIPAARLVGIAAFEGIGKTRFNMDLARRMWLRLPWPDGQPATLPERTPTLWVCADGQQDDLAAIADAFGMPDEAIVFNTTHDEPYGGTEIDKIEERERLEAFIRQVHPGLVFIDTLTNATSFDLCRATENKEMMTPLRDIAQRTQTTIVPNLHLSREGQALGRRIKGLTRTIIQLECPDPNQPSRLRLWVEKSFAKKPPALGVTMTDAGNDYDFNPPAAPAPGKPGRPAKQRDEAERFVRDALTLNNDRIGTELAAAWEKTGGSVKTLWRAVEDMVQAGDLNKDGGPGTRRQMVLHLIQAEPGTDPDAST